MVASMVGAMVEAKLMRAEVYRQGWSDGYAESLMHIGKASEVHATLQTDGVEVTNACLTDERARQVCCWEVR